MDKCNCNEECTCGENCECGNECTCGEECTCGSECKCTSEDKCSEKCTCDNEKQVKKAKKKKDKKDVKIEELEQRVRDALNEVLVAKADLINYRKRKDDEVTKMLKYANEDLVKEMLPIIDTFERAIKMDDDNLDDEVSKFLEGFKMMYCNLTSIFEKYGVKAIDGSNKQFDPTYHQAVMTEKKDGVEPGMVIEVLQKGYLLKDKVIRPAMVRVSE